MMTLVERLRASSEDGIDPETVYEAADTIEALQAENVALKRPAQRAGAMQPPVQIAPTQWGKWGIVGMVQETDEEFAGKGRDYVEIAG